MSSDGACDFIPQMITHKVEDWNFFTEGETCFIFDCASQPLILRVNKHYVDEGLPIYNGIIKDKTTIGCLKTSQFNKAILSRLVPKKYLLNEENSFEIDTKLANILNCSLDKNRHKLRQQNTHVTVGSVGTIIRNMCSYNSYTGSKNTLDDSPSIMIEIKPKYGFVPNRQFISPRFCPYKCILCRFCMHKHVKAAKGLQDYKMKKLDEYCPQKLFSSDLNDVKDAVNALFERPNKNLKLFYNKTSDNDNQKFFNDERTDQLKKLLVHILHTDSNSCYYEGNQQLHNSNDFERCTFFDKPIELMNKIFANTTKCIQYESDFCDYKPPEECLISPLHKCARNNDFTLAKKLNCSNHMGPRGILGIIQKLQSVDLIGVEHLYAFYESLMSTDSKSCMDNYDCDEWKKLVDDLIAGKSIEKIGKDSVCRVMLYLLSMVFRDCSIVINLKACNDIGCDQTLSTLTNGSTNGNDYSKIFDAITHQTSDSHLHYDIKIIDCDPKTHKNIPYYYHMDQSIVRNYSYLKSPYRIEIPVNIRFFGPLRDIFYSPHLQVYLPRTVSINYVINLLTQRQPAIKSAISACSISLNYEYLLIGDDEPFDVIAGDEIGIIEFVGAG